MKMKNKESENTVINKKINKAYFLINKLRKGTTLESHINLSLNKQDYEKLVYAYETLKLEHCEKGYLERSKSDYKEKEKELESHLTKEIYSSFVTEIKKYSKKLLSKYDKFHASWKYKIIDGVEKLVNTNSTSKEVGIKKSREFPYRYGTMQLGAVHYKEHAIDAMKTFEEVPSNKIKPFDEDYATRNNETRTIEEIDVKDLPAYIEYVNGIAHEYFAEHDTGDF